MVVRQKNKSKGAAGAGGGAAVANPESAGGAGASVFDAGEAPRAIVRTCPATGGSMRVFCWRGRYVVEPQPFGKEVLWYSDGRKLVDKIAADREYVEGVHYIKLTGAELAEFKAFREVNTDSVFTSEEDYKFAHHAILLTEKGTRLAAMKARTPAGVAVREWLVKVWEEIDHTGRYSAPGATGGEVTPGLRSVIEGVVAATMTTLVERLAPTIEALVERSVERSVERTATRAAEHALDRYVPAQRQLPGFDGGEAAALRRELEEVRGEVVALRRDYGTGVIGPKVAADLLRRVRDAAKRAAEATGQPARSVRRLWQTEMERHTKHAGQEASWENIPSTALAEVIRLVCRWERRARGEVAKAAARKALAEKEQRDSAERAAQQTIPDPKRDAAGGDGGTPSA